MTRYRTLADAYATAAITTAHAHGALSPVIVEAHELLTARGTTSSGSDATNAIGALEQLDALVHEFAAERSDLTERANLIQSADARTAYLLSTAAGRIIDITVATMALESGWTYDEALFAQELEELLALQRPFTAAQSERVALLMNELAVLDAPFTVGAISGDLDSNFTEPRVGIPLHIDPGPAVERGRDLIIRALRDTADPDQILRDEFEVFFHDNGNLTLVLPGVIDLSSPRFGRDPETQSLRDLDQQAINSAFSTGVEDNGYAQRIVEWTEEMVSAGVIAPGTQTTIIGHSFGGDTAFDLASDEHFNGELLDVTHTFSAGYFSFPQLEHIPARTSALTTANIYDLVLLAEQLSHVGVRPTDRIAYAAIEHGTNRTTRLLNRFRTIPLPRIDISKERVRSTAPNGLHAEFEGGFTATGVGHHQDEYIDYLERVDDVKIEQFLSELDDEGFTSNAVALSIDISDPAGRR